MANNTGSNYTEKLAKKFLASFESSRVVTKTVDTQLISDVGPSNGGSVSVKRPHDYLAYRSAGGDISGSGSSDIIAGKATAVVQNYITVAANWSDLEEALQLDQLDKIIAPMATRACTELETSLAAYMRNNCNLSIGTPGTAVDAWADIAGAGSLMMATGVPMDGTCYYVADPYTSQNIAAAQSALAAGPDGLVGTAWQRAQLSKDVGGLQVITSNALGSFTSGANTDLAGALTSAPTATYVGAKDTMTQDWVVKNFGANGVIAAGSIVEVTGKFRMNQATRLQMTGPDGAGVKFRGVVTADVTLSGTGTGTINVAGAAIYEASGQYNTVNAALATDDVVTVLNATATTYQPNLFYKRDAFGMATVKLPKLYATDTVFTTKDGISIRCTKYADGDTNTQKVRFDILPAFATFNPFFAGQGYGI